MNLDIILGFTFGLDLGLLIFLAYLWFQIWGSRK
jgi:hypothetical protein